MLNQEIKHTPDWISAHGVVEMSARLVPKGEDS